MLAAMKTWSGHVSICKASLCLKYLFLEVKIAKSITNSIVRVKKEAQLLLVIKSNFFFVFVQALGPK